MRVTPRDLTRIITTALAVGGPDLQPADVAAVLARGFAERGSPTAEELLPAALELAVEGSDAWQDRESERRQREYAEYLERKTAEVERKHDGT